TQDRPDRARYHRMITMPATPPVNRAGVKTGGTANTFQRTAEVFTPQLTTPPIIHNYHMDFLTRPRADIVTRIARDRLTCSASGKQAKESTQVTILRKKFFYTHTCNMYRCRMNTH